MDIVDAIARTLDMNGNLSTEFKSDIFELIKIFHNKFPEVDLTNLKNRLATLEVKKIGKFLCNDASMYDNSKNILYFNSEKLDSECDGKHVLMFELLNIITSTDTQKGFERDGRFEALNIGFTEILANHLVGNESDVPLHEEQALETNLISIIIGVDVMKQAYFTNDTDLLIKSIQSTGVQA